MPNCHPTVKTYEEFCKYYEQESDIGKRRLYQVHEVAQKFLEARRKRERRRYYEKKQEAIEANTISIQTEPEPEPIKPVPNLEVPLEPVSSLSKGLETIPEEPPKKEKRNSFTIPRSDINFFQQTVAPSPSFPSIISDTKKKREPKTVPK